MDLQQSLLAAIPDDPVGAFALADFLEERDDPRSELLRLSYTLREWPDVTADRLAVEARVRALLLGGVAPCVPAWTNAAGMTFAWVPPGAFLMGSPVTEPGRLANERQHLVKLTRGFYLATTPVTVAQWQAVAGAAPGGGPAGDHPVGQVTWHQAKAFCAGLRKLDGRPYRLPTEAEWEYACRGGTSTPYQTGDDPEGVFAVAHCGQTSTWSAATGTVAVGQRPPNAWGLYDMHGNVWEWCEDAFAEYPKGEVRDPAAAGPGAFRVHRGGAFYSHPWDCRSAYRNWHRPDAEYPTFGLRVCFSKESG